MPGVKLDLRGIDRFARRQSEKFLKAAAEAGAEILSELTDGDIETESAGNKASITLVSPTAVIDETGTESRPPDPKIIRLIKDRNLRNRMLKQAERSLR